MRILAIESSCDESSIAWMDSQEGTLKHWVSSQIEAHATYGGVVPDIASALHLKQLPALLKNPALPAEHPDRIVVTNGPGLAPCLAMGIACAEALSLAWNAPLYPGNHLRAHAYSPFIPLYNEFPAHFESRLKALLPHLGLLVSGGNTLLFKITQSLQFEIIADTVDDAAGEALDKGAKLLGLGYPGGPALEMKAREGNPHAINFPRAFPQPNQMKFSFSGLKTSLRYYLEKIDEETFHQQLADICASYQQAVVDALCRKVNQALQLAPAQSKSIGLSGGVAQNQTLRARVQDVAQKHHLRLLPANPEHCGDNAAMIAFAHWINPNTSSLSLQPSLSL